MTNVARARPRLARAELAASPHRERQLARSPGQLGRSKSACARDNTKSIRFRFASAKADLIPETLSFASTRRP